MEIQKIFSSEYDDEKLYSVILDENEYSLYQSLFSKNKDKKK